ncbi:hypothetical protein HKBW3S33_00507 [Candidatus Hakubella thermalkaliphila]|uniref:Uracil-DNA glycosylase-like domain-containing protein n=1 Tax=Candidatus Hakubella thermalkaliphila TaxID=2754717 RepID=A0A6V8P3E2_9ACTN|nr:hypothetical protein HKBW3S33_00507 [Candidatus Hakubella thermalkaliphila]
MVITKMNFECSKCKNYGLKYSRKYMPSDFLEGKRDSPIWIIGLNPKGNLEKNDERDVTELENCFEGDIHPYFHDFKKVSKKLYNLFGKERGVAHTDIVKCFSNEFPPKNCKRKEAQIIISNCKGYLEEQINKYFPKIIICNGSPVCKIIKRVIKPQIDYITSYVGNFDEKEIAVILSGFIGRLDDYAKLRLGKEIESYIER